ncbi:hypothetical protein M0804_010720 [Polistes exclamans]|nr:hypothetical protein M0804_010720 [Polistes exclamans]
MHSFNDYIDIIAFNSKRSGTNLIERENPAITSDAYIKQAKPEPAETAAAAKATVTNKHNVGTDESGTRKTAGPQGIAQPPIPFTYLILTDKHTHTHKFSWVCSRRLVAAAKARYSNLPFR